MPRIYNLALGGVGVDGAPFVGALKQFQRTSGNHLKHLKRVVGSSTGGIIAMMIALNYSVDEIEKFCNEELVTHKLENKTSKNKCTYDGKKLEDLIKTLIFRKTSDVDFLFNELDPKKGYKDLHIITMMAYMQDGTPKTRPHVFNKQHTGKTKIRDAVLASASIPGLYPIIFFDRKGDSCWEKGTEYHHIPDLLVLPPLEEYFDKKEYFEEELTTLHNSSINSTLCFITHNDSPSNGEWEPLPQENAAELMYSLTSALMVAFQEELSKNEKTSKTPKEYERTVLIENSNPTIYGDKNEKKLSLAAAEDKVKSHFELKSIAEEKKSELSSSRSSKLGNKFSTLFSSSPAHAPATKPAENKDEPAKRKCLLM